jgi:hypothetical protein
MNVSAGLMKWPARQTPEWARLSGNGAGEGEPVIGRDPQLRSLKSGGPGGILSA